jgi:hypothetical protein
LIMLFLLTGVITCFSLTSVSRIQSRTAPPIFYTP